MGDFQRQYKRASRVEVGQGVPRIGGPLTVPMKPHGAGRGRMRKVRKKKKSGDPEAENKIRTSSLPRIDQYLLSPHCVSACRGRLGRAETGIGALGSQHRRLGWLI